MLIGAPVMAVVCSLVIGAFPTRRLGGDEALVAMMVAGAVSTLATVLGSIPVIWAMKRSPGRVPVFAMGAVLLRMIILVALVVPIGVLSSLPLRALLLWVAIAYLFALGAETVVVTSMIRRMGKPE
jgi:hypothetical protein